MQRLVQSDGKNPCQFDCGFECKKKKCCKKYKKGKRKIINAFIGKAMQKTDRRGHGEKISLILKNLLTDD